MYAPFVNEGLATLHVIGRYVTQHLQLIVTLAYERTQCHGNGESHHVGARNAHPHGILQDIGTEQHVNLLGLHTQFLCCHGGTETYGHRFRASHGRNDLSLDKSYDFFFCHC